MAKQVGLNPKQKAFVKEYLIDLNASAAYLRAGYKTDNPNICGPRMLSHVLIKQEIQKGMDKRAKKVEITAEYVLSNLKEIGERCLQRAPVMKYNRETKMVEQARDEEGRAVWQFDPQGALRANELMGKHLKLFTDRMEVDVTDDLAQALAKATARVKGSK